MILMDVLHLRLFYNSVNPSQQIKCSRECLTLVSLVRLFLLYYFLDILLVIFDEQVHHINTEIIDQDVGKQIHITDSENFGYGQHAGTEEKHFC